MTKKQQAKALELLGKWARKGGGVCPGSYDAVSCRSARLRHLCVFCATHKFLEGLRDD